MRANNLFSTASHSASSRPIAVDLPELTSPVKATLNFSFFFPPKRPPNIPFFFSCGGSVPRGAESGPGWTKSWHYLMSSTEWIFIQKI